MIALTRYWFEFELDDVTNSLSLNIGCGVTAYNYKDALFQLSEQLFKSTPVPKIKKVIENVDLTTLDQGHVIPNMLPPNNRGIWYPLGHQFL